jgi:hypothetical protein
MTFITFRFKLRCLNWTVDFVERSDQIRKIILDSDTVDPTEFGLTTIRQGSRLGSKALYSIAALVSMRTRVQFRIRIQILNPDGL